MDPYERIQRASGRFIDQGTESMTPQESFALLARSVVDLLALCREQQVEIDALKRRPTYGPLT